MGGRQYEQMSAYLLSEEQFQSTLDMLFETWKTIPWFKEAPESDVRQYMKDRVRSALVMTVSEVVLDKGEPVYAVFGNSLSNYLQNV